jgi:hypothetical protein
MTLTPLTTFRRYWRGYDVRLHPKMVDDGFKWESELAMLDTWLEEHAALPPVNFIEIHPRRVLLVMRGLFETIVLAKTADGLKQEDP